jgi:hypothetical protein
VVVVFGGDINVRRQTFGDKVYLKIIHFGMPPPPKLSLLYAQFFCIYKWRASGKVVISNAVEKMFHASTASSLGAFDPL